MLKGELKMFFVTKEWIHSYMPNGGVTKKQLEALGFSWPPQKGWLKEITGKEISDEQARLFREGVSKKKDK